jgi:subtilisin family serine protease
VFEFANVIDVVNASFRRFGSPIIDGNGLVEGSCRAYILPLDFYHYFWCQVALIGIPVVVAAGNDAVDAKNVVPAAFNEVMTVSNMTWSFTRTGRRQIRYELWRTSNFGADVDIAAPGVNIRSTLPTRTPGTLGKRGQPYGGKTGTSMAAPHVAGAAALYIAAHGRNDSALLVYNAIKSRATLVPLRGDRDGITEGFLNVADLWRS